LSPSYNCAASYQQIYITLQNKFIYFTKQESRYANKAMQSQDKTEFQQHNAKNHIITSLPLQAAAQLVRLLNYRTSQT
jgi:hypothetical protein